MDQGRTERAEVDWSGGRPGLTKGLPDLLYKYAVRAEIRRTQRCRVNQREKGTCVFHAPAQWNRYFKRCLRAHSRHEVGH